MRRTGSTEVITRERVQSRRRKAKSQQLNRDEKGSRRLKVTDEEALAELNRFKSEIDKVTLPTRYQFWLIQYILIIIAITGVYVSSFPFNKKPDEEMLSKVSK